MGGGELSGPFYTRDADIDGIQDAWIWASYFTPFFFLKLQTNSKPKNSRLGD